MTDSLIERCARTAREAAAIERRMTALKDRIERAITPHGYATDIVIVRMTKEEAEMIGAILAQVLGK